jgi:hypothetical protein
MNVTSFETVTLKGDVDQKLGAVGIDADSCRQMLQVTGLKVEDFEGLTEAVTACADIVLQAIDAEHSISSFEDDFTYEEDGQTVSASTNGAGYGEEYHAELIRSALDQLIGTACQGRAFKRTVVRNAELAPNGEKVTLDVFSATPAASKGKAKRKPPTPQNS